MLAVFSGKGGHSFMIIGLWDTEFSKECLKTVALKDKFDLNKKKIHIRYTQSNRF